MRCRHCRQTKPVRDRGLCWACRSTPGVRNLYPSTSPYSRRGIGTLAEVPEGKPPPWRATDAPLGSPEREAVLMQRALWRQRLTHPLDTERRAETLAGCR